MALELLKIASPLIVNFFLIMKFLKMLTKANTGAFSLHLVGRCISVQDMKTTKDVLPCLFKATGK